MGFPVPAAVRALCVPCSRAASLMLGEVPEQSESKPWPLSLLGRGCARHLGMPDTSGCRHRPCCASLPRGKGAPRGCAQQVSGSVLVAQLDRWQVPLVPAHLQPCSPHTQILIPSSPLQWKAWKPEPDARLHLSLQTAGSNNSGRYKLRLSS